MLSACQTVGGPPLPEIAATVNSTLEPNTLLLGIGDTLELRFPYAPAWTQEVEVGTDGRASFMAIGRLVVAGMTLEELEAALGRAYAPVFEDHELDVVVKSRGARKVYVLGEVKTPGELVLDPDQRLTLLGALARAGGPLNASAYLAHTQLIRWSASAGKQMSWTIDARDRHWNGSVPLYLQPYDLVYIPNTPIDEVAIWVDNYIRRMIPFPYLFSVNQ